MKREHITPDWTLGQLKEQFPGVELTLFAYFGVGSRERSGFAASERLEDLLRRHLVFDAEKACARLDAMAQEDWQYSYLAPALKAASDQGALVVDVRSAEVHQLCRIEGSRLLDAALVGQLRTATPKVLITVCADGSQAPAASRHLRKLGLPAYHLHGGLMSWSKEVDASFPIMYPLFEVAERWHLLADGNTLRFRRVKPHQLEPRLWLRQDLGQNDTTFSLLHALPELEMIASSPFSFAARGQWPELHRVIETLSPWLDRDELWARGGATSDLWSEREKIEYVLSQEAPKILHAHRGSVEVASYTPERVLTLRLGGGCAGCASANVTTQRELAAALYREVPLLDSIISAETAGA